MIVNVHSTITLRTDTLEILIQALTYKVAWLEDDCVRLRRHNLVLNADFNSAKRKMILARRAARAAVVSARAGRKETKAS